MKSLFKDNKIFFSTLIISISFLGLAQYWFNTQTSKPKLNISKQDEALNFNENFLRLSSFGQERLLSSLVWVMTLMESDIEHYKENDLNSWMYLRFKTISSLDPFFYENYHYGGKYLSIVKDDLLGARDIYERGLRYYPNDFWLRFNNGFNYYFEMGQKDKGLENFSIIENDPLVEKHAPYLPTLIARMRAEKGKLQLAYDMLFSIYERTEEKSLFRQKQEQRLYELKSKIDLRCLNSNPKKTDKQSDCDKKDFLDRPYIRSSSGEYKAQGYFKN